MTFPTLEAAPVVGIRRYPPRNKLTAVIPIAFSSLSRSTRTEHPKMASSSCAKSCFPTAILTHPTPALPFSDDEGAWFGFEQEYFLEKDGEHLGFPKAVILNHRANTTAVSAYKNVGDIGRAIVDEHLDLCLYAGINHEGINAEVAMGQWEFQVFGKGSKRAADQIWVARFLLLRLCEEYGVDM